MTKMKRNYSKSDSGCFSGIFRRMLCSGNVSTHASSPEKIPNYYPNTTKLLKNTPGKLLTQKSETETEPKAGPNLVARLMGLDSLPPSYDFPRKSSFFRSRSVNFADYLLNFDPIKHDKSLSLRHRRVRTSVSFREVPSSPLKPQSGEFVVVYLDSMDESKPEKEKNNNKSTKKKKNISVENHYGKPKNGNKVNDSKLIRSKASTTGKGKNGGSLKDVKHKVMKKENAKKVPERFARKRKTTRESKKVRMIESIPDKSRPASSLKITPDGQSRPVNPETKTRTKSREQKVGYHGNDEFELRSRIKKGIHNKSTSDIQDPLDFTKLAELLLRLTELDLSESCWVFNSTKNTKICFEEICMEFEEIILDALLNEIASDLFVQFY